MSDVNKYCDSVKKKTRKLLKKMFGFKTVKEGFDEKKRIVRSLENSTGKRISDLNEADVKKVPYMYAKYRTLCKILSVYVNLMILDKFCDVGDCDEY